LIRNTWMVVKKAFNTDRSHVNLWQSVSPLITLSQSFRLQQR
jgi:hypothetical protein